MSRAALGLAGLAGLALVLGCGDEPGPGSPEPSAARETRVEAPTPLPASPVPRAEPAAPPASPPTLRGDAANGQHLYAQYCALCHGPGGRGDGPTAAALKPLPADHTDAAYMGGLSDEHLFKVIEKGGSAVGKSPLMAPWGGVLSTEQIRDVLAHVRKLSGT